MTHQIITPAAACAQGFKEQFSQLNAVEQLEVLELIKDTNVKEDGDTVQSYFYYTYQEYLDNLPPIRIDHVKKILLEGKLSGMLYTMIRKPGGFVLKDKPFLTPSNDLENYAAHDILEHPLNAPDCFIQEELMSYGGMLRVRQDTNKEFGHWLKVNFVYHVRLLLAELRLKSNSPADLVFEGAAKPEAKLLITKFKVLFDEEGYSLYNEDAKIFEYFITKGIEDFDKRFKNISCGKAKELFYSINHKFVALEKHSNIWTHHFVERVREFTLEIDFENNRSYIYNIKKINSVNKIKVNKKWYSPNSPELYTEFVT